MRFMLIVKASNQSEAGVLPSERRQPCGIALLWDDKFMHWQVHTHA